MHLPVLAAFVLMRGVGGAMVWGEPAAMVVLLGLGVGLRSQSREAARMAAELRRVVEAG